MNPLKQAAMLREQRRAAALAADDAVRITKVANVASQEVKDSESPGKPFVFPDTIV